VKRNVSGAVNAVVSSQMALAGVRSVIPPDEVIDSMRRIGKLLPACLRETGQEGLATTPTARKIAQSLK
jgi:L-serine dehydratase